MNNVKKTASCITFVLLGALPVALSGGSVATAVQPVPVACIANAAIVITPTATGGLTYKVNNGAGQCLQGAPFNGDWSVKNIRGHGTATSFTCTPGGFLATVSGLKLNLSIKFANNKTGVKTFVKEIWTQTAPNQPMSATNVTVNPGGTPGQIATHIFNACPGAGTPSSKLTWSDSNPR